MPGRNLLQQADGGAVGDSFSEFIPAGILFGAEVRAVKQFLQTQDLYLLASRLLNQIQVLLDHGVANLGKRVLGPKDIARLNQATANNS
jgi:hypothetical protein